MSRFRLGRALPIPGLLVGVALAATTEVQWPFRVPDSITIPAQNTLDARKAHVEAQLGSVMILQPSD